MSAAAPSSKRSIIKAFLVLEKNSKIRPTSPHDTKSGRLWNSYGYLENEVVMAQQLNRIMEGIEQGHLKPVIDSVFEAKDAAKAHQHIHDAKNIGKVLLKFN